MGSEIEAKSICVHKLEDLLLDPMFTIFQVQHAQIASKTETKNTLIYHLKCSMTKVRTWNSTTVRDFCSNLMTRFPALKESFIILFRELQELTCKILNHSSESSTYSPISEEVHTYLHSFISACSDAFISHIHWFAVEESSTEYQSCKNNAKVRMQQAKVVENTVMNFVKAGPKEAVVEKVTEKVEKVEKKTPSEGSLFEDVGVNSDSNSDKSQGDDQSDDFTSDNNSSDDSSDSRTLGNKSIDLISGVVKDGEDEGPQFSTPFAKQKKRKSRKINKVDSDSDCYDTFSSSSDSSDSEEDSDYTSDNSSDDSDDDSSGSEYSDSSSDSDSDVSDESSSDSSSDDSESSDDSVSSFDTDFDCGSSSSSGTDTDDTEGSGSEGSGSSISAGEISSSDEDNQWSSDMLLNHILKLKRKENRHREKKKKF